MLAQKFGGISRYIYEISSRLPALGADVNLSCVHNHNYYFAERFGIHKMTQISRGIFHCVNKAKRFFDIRRGNYDIIHPTYYYASKPSRGKFIVTVHDMTHENYEGIYPISGRVINAKRKIIPQADRIISVSENTKRDILKYFPGINPAIISVIYHGSSLQPVMNANPLVPYDYVLFVGMRSMYKNFSRFTEAMRGIMSHDKYYALAEGISKRRKYHHSGNFPGDFIRPDSAMTICRGRIMAHCASYFRQNMRDSAFRFLRRLRVIALLFARIQAHSLKSQRMQQNILTLSTLTTWPGKLRLCFMMSLCGKISRLAGVKG